jgi:hypothetical protein
MNTNQRLILTALSLVFCLCYCSHTNALAGEKNSYYKKPAKVPPRVARSRLMRSALKSRAVYQQLHQTVDLSALMLNTTFSEAIEFVCNSTEPPLNVVVMWRDLNDNANIDQDTPIKIDGVPKIQLYTGLDILLLAVSSEFAKLGYIVKDGIIIIATKDSLPVKMNTRVYDVSYLLSAPARYGFGFRPGFARGWQAGPYNGRGGQSGRGSGTIADIVRDNVRPNRWR